MSLTRRKLLEYASALSATTMTGCGGAPSGADSSGTEGSSSTGVPATSTAIDGSSSSGGPGDGLPHYEYTRIIGRDLQPDNTDDPLDLDDPERDLLGAEQEAWLMDHGASTDAQWVLVGQQVLMA